MLFNREKIDSGHEPITIVVRSKMIVLFQQIIESEILSLENEKNALMNRIYRTTAEEMLRDDKDRQQLSNIVDEIRDVLDLSKALQVMNIRYVDDHSDVPVQLSANQFYTLTDSLDKVIQKAADEIVIYLIGDKQKISLDSNTDIESFVKDYNNKSDKMSFLLSIRQDLNRFVK